MSAATGLQRSVARPLGPPELEGAAEPLEFPGATYPKRRAFEKTIVRRGAFGAQERQMYIEPGGEWCIAMFIT